MSGEKKGWKAWSSEVMLCCWGYSGNDYRGLREECRGGGGEEEGGREAG
jgi:hypothetical protein